LVIFLPLDPSLDPSLKGRRVYPAGLKERKVYPLGLENSLWSGHMFFLSREEKDRQEVAHSYGDKAGIRNICPF
jgi:hypothetical protein